MNPLFVAVPLWRAAFVLFVATFAVACAQTARPHDPAATPPPNDASEQVVRSADGRAAAQLVVSSGHMKPGDKVTVHIANRGQVSLNHGRPVVVERWNGSAWEETEESRTTAWTMELLQIEAGRSGVEQPWPFQSERRPVPGWYRFTKDLYTADGSRDPERLIVRARVEVAMP